MELAALLTGAGRAADALTHAERGVRIAPFDADAREFAARVALKIALEGDRDAFSTAAHHIEALTIIEPRVERHRQRLARVRELADR
jgi:hypothetical protein